MPLGELNHGVIEGDVAFSLGPFIQLSISEGVCFWFF